MFAPIIPARGAPPMVNRVIEKAVSGIPLNGDDLTILFTAQRITRFAPVCTSLPPTRQTRGSLFFADKSSPSFYGYSRMNQPSARELMSTLRDTGKIPRFKKYVSKRDDGVTRYRYFDIKENKNLVLFQYI